MIIRISMLLGAILLAGCSTFPEKIAVADDQALVSYEQASSSAEQVKGQMIRWGGAIAKVENKADFTLFEMVHYPLNGYGRPIVDDESMGRFRIKVNGFMDPMVYQVGRLMTFTGELGELEKGAVGEHEYVFPTANAKAYYLWKKAQRVDVMGVYLWHQDFWHGYYPRPYHGRFYIRANSSSGKGAKARKEQNDRPKHITTYPKPVMTKKAEKKY